MSKLNSLHIDMAEVLTECAKSKTTISYSDLCKRINYPSPRAIGKELEKVSLVTYEKYGIFISALVVQKEMSDKGLLVSGDGFYSMYRRECPNDNRDIYTIGNEQREKIFSKDWSKLPQILRNEMKN